MDKNAKVYVAGHGGLVGSAVWRALRDAGVHDLVGWRSAELDLRDREAMLDAVMSSRPDVMIVAAARVGGILANATEPVDFLNDNLLIQTSLLEAAHAAGVERLIFSGIVVHLPEVRIAADRGVFAPHRRARVDERGIRHCEDRGDHGDQGVPQAARAMISAMPTNLYGPGDNFDLTRSHVLPAMIRKWPSRCQEQRR